MQLYCIYSTLISVPSLKTTVTSSLLFTTIFSTRLLQSASSNSVISSDCPLRTVMNLPICSYLASFSDIVVQTVSYSSFSLLYRSTNLSFFLTVHRLGSKFIDGCRYLRYFSFRQFLPRSFLIFFIR